MTFTRNYDGSEHKSRCSAPRAAALQAREGKGSRGERAQALCEETEDDGNSSHDTIDEFVGHVVGGFPSYYVYVYATVFFVDLVFVGTSFYDVYVYAIEFVLGCVRDAGFSPSASPSRVPGHEGD